LSLFVPAALNAPQLRARGPFEHYFLNFFLNIIF
jgi:hypothetical protein